MQKKNTLSQNTEQSLGTSWYAQSTKFILQVSGDITADTQAERD